MRLRNRRLKNIPDDPNRDLGFGSILSSSKQRLLNPDGSFNVERTGLGFWQSLNAYHALLTMPLWIFLAWLTVSYLAVNLVFAALYMLAGPGSLSGMNDTAPLARFIDTFFFSVHTFTTIGYGNMTPTGAAANLLVTAEALTGLLYQALATGLLFARFSKPNPRIMFSRNALMAPYRDITAFMFRLSNKQKNELINVNVRVMFTFFELAYNNQRIRRFYVLNLERESVALLPTAWTVVHPLDENSPMLGLSHQDLILGEAEWIIQLTGVDQTFFQTVHTWSSYRAEDMVWGARFRNIYNDGQWNSRGKIIVDLSRMNEYDPADLPEPVALPPEE